MILKKKKGLYWPPRPYKRYKAIKGLERPGGDQEKCTSGCWKRPLRAL